jgi:Kelch motif/Galactose oxidase, central domain
MMNRICGPRPGLFASLNVNMSRSFALLVALIVSLGMSRLSSADPAGVMVHPRFFHTATLLADGRVLAVGGYTAVPGGFLPTTTAEIYDPATNAWSETGSMNQARYAHVATLLADGRVLVADGSDVFRVKTAELYDPATGTWTTTQSMIDVGVANLTLLDDGTVLSAGATLQHAADCELYNPAIGKWSLTGSLNFGRSACRATLLGDGRVLVAGGVPPNSPGFAKETELYDPAAGTWTLAGDLNRGRSQHAQVLLPDGRVLVAGGFDGHPSGITPGNVAELFDPATGLWTLARPMNSPRAYFSGNLFGNGNVLVAGGVTTYHDFTLLNTLEQYDTATGRWHLLTTTLASGPRYQHTGTTLLDGRVLIAGGRGLGDRLMPTAEIFRAPR